jgi:fatty-acyl-CoA synthase
MYIGDYLARRELYSPEQLAILDFGKQPVLTLTYRQINARANRFAYWLRSRAGISKGDRVAILARDGVEHLDTLFACSKLGAIHTALNWRLHPQEIAGIFENLQPQVLIYSGDFLETVLSLEKLLRKKPYAVRHYLHIEGQGLADRGASSTWRTSFLKRLCNQAPLTRSPAKAWKQRTSQR